jgi:5-methylcytosine-specific restriction endonuclease McrA
MTRRDFPRKVKAQAILRANGCCEACSARLKVGEAEVDHILPDALGGEPVLSNAKVLCRVCHGAKTADDIGRIRKADRQRDRHTGALAKPSSLRSAGFPKAERQARATKPLTKTLPARRNVT